MTLSTLTEAELRALVQQAALDVPSDVRSYLADPISVRISSTR